MLFNLSRDRRRRAGTAILSLVLMVQVTAACSPAANATPPRAPSPTAAGSTPTHLVTTTPTPGATEAAFELFGALPAAFDDPATIARFQAALDAGIARGAPDMIGAVISPRGSWSGAAGVVGFEGRAATPKDEYYVGGISLIITAALAMRLAEQGKLDLDAPIASYLGDLAVDANGATVRQALAMRSGLANAGSDATDAIRANPARVWALDEIIPWFPAPTTAPGTKYIESGLNYTLVGVATGAAAKIPFGQALRTTVLDPVGATRIVHQEANAPTPKPWALPTAAHVGAFEPKDYGVGGVISCISSVSFSFGYGSLAGDAPSVAEWMWHLFAGDILSKTSLQAMLPGADGHGLGFKAVEFLDSSTVIGQIGSKTGYNAVLAVYPVEQTVVVMFVNDLDFAMEPTMVQLRNIALGR